MFKKCNFILLAVVLCIFAALFTCSADAATYRNDSSGTIWLKNTQGKNVAVAPGESIETYHVYNKSGLTKTSGTPYFNPIVARHSVASTGEGDDQWVELNVSATTHVLVYKVAGANVTVFYEHTENTPAVAVLRPGDRFRADHGGRVGWLVLQFSSTGTCEVVETREPMKSN